MFTKKSYKYVLNFWFSFFLSIAMSTVMSLTSPILIPLSGTAIAIIEGTIIAYMAGIIVPINSWADAFAKKCKAQEGTLVFRLLSHLIVTLYFVTIMSFAFTALAIGFPPFYFIAAVSGIPLGFAAGYIVGLIVAPLALRLTDLMTNKPIQNLEE